MTRVQHFKYLNFSTLNPGPLNSTLWIWCSNRSSIRSTAGTVSTSVSCFSILYTLRPTPQHTTDIYALRSSAQVQYNIKGVFHLTNRNWFRIHRISHCICKTETGLDQTLQTGFETVYCMKPRWWSLVMNSLQIFLLTNFCIILSQILCYLYSFAYKTLRMSLYSHVHYKRFCWVLTHRTLLTPCSTTDLQGLCNLPPPC